MSLLVRSWPQAAGYVSLLVVGQALTACASSSYPRRSAEAHQEATRPRLDIDVRAAGADTSLRVVLGGDVMFGRYFGAELRSAGGEAPFANISQHLGSGVTLVNLETPLSDVDPKAISERTNFPARHLRFRAPTRYARALADAGVDVAVLANNHAEDCGITGLGHTVAALDAAGVAHVGAHPSNDPHQTLTLRRHGLRIAVVPGTTRRNRGSPRPGQRVPVAFMNTLRMLEVLPARVAALARSDQHDLIIVTLHWGGEFEDVPHRLQVALARALIDAGAHVVHGHHAHVLQPIEVYKGRPIFYNTGNLIFDMKQPNARRTALFEARFVRSGEADLELAELVVVPLMIDGPDSGPRPADAEEFDQILGALRTNSRQRFDTSLRRAGDRLVWRRDHPASPDRAELSRRRTTGTEARAAAKATLEAASDAAGRLAR